MVHKVIAWQSSDRGRGFPVRCKEGQLGKEGHIFRGWNMYTRSVKGLRMRAISYLSVTLLRCRKMCNENICHEKGKVSGGVAWGVNYLGIVRIGDSNIVPLYLIERKNNEQEFHIYGLNRQVIVLQTHRQLGLNLILTVHVSGAIHKQCVCVSKFSMH